MAPAPLRLPDKVAVVLGLVGAVVEEGIVVGAGWLLALLALDNVVLDDSSPLSPQAVVSKAPASTHTIAAAVNKRLLFVLVRNIITFPLLYLPNPAIIILASEICRSSFGRLTAGGSGIVNAVLLVC